ncbi:hypothetical protein, partial [Culturomica massiliensis]
ALPTELFSHFTIHSFEKPSCQGRILLFRGQGRALPTELFSHFMIHSFEKPSCQGRILLFRGQGRALPTELFSRCVKEHFSLASANIKRFLVYTNKNAKKYHNRHKTFRKIIYPI